VEQIIELCWRVSLSNLVNRFHATFLTDVDAEFGTRLGDSCPLPIPPHPAASKEGSQD
jgi:hypothetical protein